MSDINTGGDLLFTTDWGQEWRRLQASKNAADDPIYWNTRAHSFPADTQTSPYAKAFLQLADIRPGETVFDMGCGSGALAVPLGKAGHKVVAADFSEAMLARMQSVLDETNVRTVFPKLMSWEEDWSEKGVRQGMVDVCIASRSIATADLEDSLMRLHDIARRRVCITLATTSSPRVDKRILSEIGIQDKLTKDYLYAINILATHNILPELSYIRSTRYDTYNSAEEAALSLQKMVDAALGCDASEQDATQAYECLLDWLEENLISNDEAGLPDSHGLPQKALRLKHPRVITWAFIAWDKE